MLKPVLRLFIGDANLSLYDTLDWEQACDRFRQADVRYPDYYRHQNFHGIEGGYLNAIAPITYDPVAALASPPSERWIRQQLVAAIEGQPAHILDLGCGTGSMALMLKHAFPQATVVGLDLSPYMLVLADHKAQQMQLDVQWQQGLAEQTRFAAASFDVVAIAFLLHETPPPVMRAILHECARLLKPQGQIAILDGNQLRLRRAKWLTTLFREPYSFAYATCRLEEALHQAGFAAVQTQPLGWISQLTTASRSRMHP